MKIIEKLQKSTAKTVGIISLGCDKNRVDSENLLFNLKQAGFSIVNEISAAQIILVNTCAFIQSARQESIDAVLEAAEYKKPPNICEKLIICGCFPVKHEQELKDNLPEADAFLRFADYENIGAVIYSLYNTNGGDTNGDGGICPQGQASADKCPPSPFVENRLLFPGRVVSTPQHYAYLKIAEGCNNRCTYCAIPSIRGPYRSRDKQSLIKEAESLVYGGAKEIILVAQDTTRYGQDSGGAKDCRGLIDLADAISRISGVEWIRLMYCYPELVDKALVDFVCGSDKVVKYLDIPLQHSEDRILKAMGRRTDGRRVRQMLDMLKCAPVKIALRSSFIVGFPGETDGEFNALLAFLKEYKIDNAGFFGYSAEEGTPAFNLPGRHNMRTIRKRVKEAGRIQKEIIRENNRALIGKTVRVLYEGIDYDKNKLYGRTQYAAPEIDTFIYFDANFADVGNFYDIMVTGLYGGFDLKGKKI